MDFITWKNKLVEIGEWFSNFGFNCWEFYSSVEMGFDSKDIEDRFYIEQIDFTTRTNDSTLSMPEGRVYKHKSKDLYLIQTTDHNGTEEPLFIRTCERDALLDLRELTWRDSKPFWV